VLGVGDLEIHDAAVMAVQDPVPMTNNAVKTGVDFA
jgi:hypothetical protein